MRSGLGRSRLHARRGTRLVVHALTGFFLLRAIGIDASAAASRILRLPSASRRRTVALRDPEAGYGRRRARRSPPRAMPGPTARKAGTISLVTRPASDVISSITCHQRCAAPGWSTTREHDWDAPADGEELVAVWCVATRVAPDPSNRGRSQGALETKSVDELDVERMPAVACLLAGVDHQLLPHPEPARIGLGQLAWQLPASHRLACRRGPVRASSGAARGARRARRAPPRSRCRSRPRSPSPGHRRSSRRSARGCGVRASCRRRRAPRWLRPRRVAAAHRRPRRRQVVRAPVPVARGRASASSPRAVLSGDRPPAPRSVSSRARSSVTSPP